MHFWLQQRFWKTENWCQNGYLRRALSIQIMLVLFVVRYNFSFKISINFYWFSEENAKMLQIRKRSRAQNLLLASRLWIFARKQHAAQFVTKRWGRRIQQFQGKAKKEVLNRISCSHNFIIINFISFNKVFFNKLRSDFYLQLGNVF